MLILDFDFIGTLIFLWFIYRGFVNSRKAKQRHAERQRQAPRPKPSTAPKNRPPRPKPVDFPRSQPVFEPEPRPHVEPQTTWTPVQEQPKPKEIKKELPKTKLEPIKNTIDKVTPKKQKENVIKDQEISWRDTAQDFTIDEKAVVNGMIWAEVLGSPRAKKKAIR